MKIRLHIESLILDGLPVNGVEAVAHLRAALEAELVRLFTAGDLGPLQTGKAVARLRAAEIKLAPATKPAQLGEQIAQSVHGAMNK